MPLPVLVLSVALAVFGTYVSTSGGSPVAYDSSGGTPTATVDDSSGGTPTHH